MFWMKDTNGKNLNIEENNVFTSCPICGKEHPVDLQTVLSTDGDLYGTQVYCPDCSAKRLDELHNEEPSTEKPETSPIAKFEEIDWGYTIVAYAGGDEIGDVAKTKNRDLADSIVELLTKQYRSRFPTVDFFVDEQHPTFTFGQSLVSSLEAASE